ncbi:MAG: DUF4157 domain-containing protein [Alphaproteobacteria bacterium]|nr:DUF4157 domain-containing protein [Alphaproteobacteria bacterium]
MRACTPRQDVDGPHLQPEVDDLQDESVLDGSPEAMLGMQGTLGNAGVLALMQEAGEADQEAEADQVARQVIGQLPPDGGPPEGDAGDGPMGLGGGRALPADLQERAEHALGADLSGVRLHDEPQAGRLALAEGAQAVAEGAHVAVAPNAPAPASPAGEALILHELTHVVQQGAAPRHPGAEHPVQPRGGRRVQRKRFNPGQRLKGAAKRVTAAASRVGKRAKGAGSGAAKRAQGAASNLVGRGRKLLSDATPRTRGAAARVAAAGRAWGREVRERLSPARDLLSAPGQLLEMAASEARDALETCTDVLRRQVLERLSAEKLRALLGRFKELGRDVLLWAVTSAPVKALLGLIERDPLGVLDTLRDWIDERWPPGTGAQGDIAASAPFTALPRGLSLKGGAAITFHRDEGDTLTLDRSHTLTLSLSGKTDPKGDLASGSALGTLSASAAGALRSGLEVRERYAYDMQDNRALLAFAFKALASTTSAAPALGLITTLTEVASTIDGDHLQSVRLTTLDEIEADASESVGLSARVSPSVAASVLGWLHRKLPGLSRKLPDEARDEELPSTRVASALARVGISVQAARSFEVWAPDAKGVTRFELSGLTGAGGAASISVGALEDLPNGPGWTGSLPGTWVGQTVRLEGHLAAGVLSLDRATLVGSSLAQRKPDAVSLGTTVEREYAPGARRRGQGQRISVRRTLSMASGPGQAWLGRHPEFLKDGAPPTLRTFLAIQDLRLNSLQHKHEDRISKEQLQKVKDGMRDLIGKQVSAQAALEVELSLDSDALEKLAAQVDDPWAEVEGWLRGDAPAPALNRAVLEVAELRDARARMVVQGDLSTGDILKLYDGIKELKELLKDGLSGASGALGGARIVDQDLLARGQEPELRTLIADDPAGFWAAQATGGEALSLKDLV